MSKSLKIIYDGPPDLKLDKNIEEAIKPLGWKRWASGINHITGERDLAFDEIGEIN